MSSRFFPALALSIFFALTGCQSLDQNPAPKRAEVLATMERVADWQIANPSPRAVDGWEQAAGYAGVMALAEISSSPRFDAAMMKMAETNAWKPAKRIYHADDHAVGQTYVELYFKHHDPRMIAPLR